MRGRPVEPAQRVESVGSVGPGELRTGRWGLRRGRWNGGCRRHLRLKRGLRSRGHLRLKRCLGRKRRTRGRGRLGGSWRAGLSGLRRHRRVNRLRRRNRRRRRLLRQLAGRVELRRRASLLASWSSSGSRSVIAVRGPDRTARSPRGSGIPPASMTSRAPVARSTTTATATISAPTACSASIAFSGEPPVVEVSSSTTTRLPARSGPSTCLPRPWSFGSLRTTNASYASPRATP